MKLVIQRVKKCVVFNDLDETVSQIKDGLFVLVCFKKDTAVNLEKAADKLLAYKLFESFSKSVVDMNYEVLIYSQFTLYAVPKGRSFSYHRAEDKEVAREMFKDFYGVLSRKYVGMVQRGNFGCRSTFDVVLDGPVTIVLEFEK